MKPGERALFRVVEESAGWVSAKQAVTRACVMLRQPQKSYLWGTPRLNRLAREGVIETDGRGNYKRKEVWHGIPPGTIRPLEDPPTR